MQDGVFAWSDEVFRWSLRVTAGRADSERLPGRLGLIVRTGKHCSGCGSPEGGGGATACCSCRELLAGQRSCGTSGGPLPQRRVARSCRFTTSSSLPANRPRSRGPSGGGPPPYAPYPRRYCATSRLASSPPIASSVNSLPRKSMQTAPRSIARPASGRSAVVTISPTCVSAAIQSSTASRPPGTWTASTPELIRYPQRGVRDDEDRQLVAGRHPVDLVLDGTGVGVYQNPHGVDRAKGMSQAGMVAVYSLGWDGQPTARLESG